tara:strand:+ start:81 stop:644 length:564 start_codon:yes stop_codon:yes gene_type:complete
MARRGRPRTKAGNRLDAKIGVLAQIQDADKKTRLSETAQVKAQPHRAWAPDPDDPRLSCALGRFVIFYGLRSELFDAGDHYGLVFARWAAAKGIPHPTRHDMIGGGLGPSDATVAAWWREIEGIEDALRRYGLAYIHVRHLCLEDEDLPAEAAADAITGLRAVAVEIGRLPEMAHPFVAPVHNRRAA